jgi:hypothetical protein
VLHTAQAKPCIKPAQIAARMHDSWLLVGDLTQKYAEITVLYRFTYPELRLFRPAVVHNFIDYFAITCGENEMNRKDCRKCAVLLYCIPI